VKTRASALFGIALAAGAAVYAQDFGRGRSRVGEERRPVAMEMTGNQPYDGRVVFLRIQYGGGFGGFGRRQREPPWAHDYPTADTHMMKILNEITLLRPRIDGSNVHSLDDPELFDYPIAYMSEPGFWAPSDEEAKGLRDYLLKGGFIIFDDFRDYDWENLVQQMQRVVPELRWVQLDSTHRIFHSFFEIDDLNYLTSYGNVQPTYWGLFENNDQSKRLVAIADRDGDLGEYWEYSDQGYFPVDLSNTAYKFGVNYFIYGLTH
jgi:hypothetical protein